MKITEKNYVVDLNKISPLKKETKNTLEKYLFKGGLSGGCGKLQNFAKNAETLQSLQKQLKNGEIDLGWKDRTIAIAKCIGSALLTAVAAAAAFTLISTFGAGGGYGAGLFSMPALASLGLFASACSDASEVFQKPSPEQLTKDLEQLKNTGFSEEDVQNIRSTLEGLKKLESDYTNGAQTAENRGDLNAKTLRANADVLMKAYGDLGKMLDALVPQERSECA